MSARKGEVMIGVDIRRPPVGKVIDAGVETVSAAQRLAALMLRPWCARATGCLLIGCDAAALAVSVWFGVFLARGMRDVSGRAPDLVPATQHFHAALVHTLPIALCILLYFVMAGVYTSRRSFWSEFGRLIAVSGFALLAAGFCAFAFDLNGPRVELLLPWLLFPFLAEAGRQYCRRALHRFGLWQIPIISVGSAEDVETARRVIDSESLPGYKIVGALSPAEALQQISRSPTLGRDGPFRILLCVEPASAEGSELIECLTRRRIPFVAIPPTANLPAHSFSTSAYFSHDTILLSYRSNLEDPILRGVKVAFDLIAATLILLIASPVFLVLYVLIALDGGQPIYGHRRIGRGGREFLCLKFRSMARNGDEILARILATDPEAAEEWSRTQKLSRDPRITRIGHFIRKTSLDELPQLLNVLRGEMSLVGPRPIVRAEMRHYGEEIEFYYAAHPGITGLWQVSGRSDTSYARRVELDRWYVRNWTLWHDIAILAKTVPAVLQRRGAR